MIEKLTPLETARACCIQCLGMKQFNTEAVKDCQGDQATNGACPFFPYRLGKRVPVKVFRRYCLYCTNGAKEYVAECPAVICPAYPYRFGKNPALAGQVRGASLTSKRVKKEVGGTLKGQISTITPQDTESIAAA